MSVDTDTVRARPDRMASGGFVGLFQLLPLGRQRRNLAVGRIDDDRGLVERLGSAPIRPDLLAICTGISRLRTSGIGSDGLVAQALCKLPCLFRRQVGLAAKAPDTN